MTEKKPAEQGGPRVSAKPIINASAPARNPLLAAALDYAERGWRVLPLHGIGANGRCTCGETECSSPGKHPLIKWKAEASTDADTVRRWWSRWPSANVAVATGPESGLLVLDVDDLQAARDLPGLGARAAVAVTGRGLHLYYAWTPELDALKTQGARLHPGLDVRGCGGYVAAPPSAHASGRRYRWMPGRGPDDREPGPPPEWVLELLRERRPAASNGAARPSAGDEWSNPPAGTGPAWAAVEREGVEEGGRNDALAGLVGHLLATGVDPAEAVERARAFAGRCRPPMDAGEIVRTAASIGRKELERRGAANPPEDLDELVAALREHPRPDAAGRGAEEIIADARALTSKAGSEVVGRLLREAASLPPAAERLVHDAIKEATGLPLATLREQAREGGSRGADHLALARSVVEAIGAENLIGQGAQTWLYRDAGVWRPLETRAEKQLVQSHLAGRHRLGRISSALVGSVADLFRTEVYRPSHTWNVGPPDAVCAPNGEIQLRGGQWILTSHRREHYRTTQIPVEFDPSATAGRFQQFLAEVFEGDPDAESKALAILEMIGYSLMAHNQFERFVILVGAGANGKSVLLAVLEALLGRESVAGVQPCHFGRSFQRAHLHLKLANIVTEVREGEVIADAELKAIVSGELTTAEHKFCDPFEMRPYATCWFGTNHMPHTRDFSDALFRRALVVPFNRRFTLGENADPRLKEKLLAELPGVLNLALTAYAGAVRRGHPTEPASCVEAKREWRLNADQAAQFVDEWCSDEPGEVPSRTLYDAYLRWAAGAGVHRTLTQKSFAERVERLGYEKRHTRAGRMFAGLRLKAAEGGS